MHLHRNAYEVGTSEADAPGNVIGQVTAPVQAMDKMYDAPLPASRTGALYNAFSYPTKISPEAIALFIATHTKPGAVVADVFAGSGTTGVATLLCERPTAGMLAMAKQLRLEPAWGARTAHLFDVGTLGCFIAEVLTSPPNPQEFVRAAEQLIDEASERLAGLYKATDPDGKAGQIRHIVWSEILICPRCEQEHLLWDVATQRDPARFLSTFDCPSCHMSAKVEDCRRRTENVEDVFGRTVEQRARVPVEVHGITAGRRWMRQANSADLETASRWTDIGVPESAPDAEIIWGELRRAGYHSGITHLHHFYTPRNFVAVATCLDLAKRWPEPLASALRFLILSYNASHSTLMTRIVAKKAQKDFILTGAQSGVLYISGLPIEKNVIEGLRRKAKVMTKAFELLHGAQGRVEVHNVSSESLPIPTASVDYVFTDPPFGDYIPYAELNQINELWLEKSTNRSSETVVSKSGAKDEDHYQRSMTAIFREVHRVLKHDGLSTVVFHSAHSRIWRALTEALGEAGLRVRRTSVLDKMQASFKQVVSTISVKGDPVILLDKVGSVLSSRGDNEIFDRIKREYESSSNKDARAFFSRYAAECIFAGQPVSFDAATFARLIATSPS